MPTIEINFKLTASETSTGATGSAAIVDSPATIGVADSNIWSLDEAGVDQNLSELQSIGVTSVRLPIPWTFIESQNGTFTWSKMDTIIAAARARGMSIVGTITGNPAWDGTVGIGQPNVQEYASFASAVASRYSSEISAFEIWNEENSQGFFAGPKSAEVYTAVLKAAYTAIKAVDPTATVLVGGLASVANIAGLNQSPQNFLSQILADGAAGYFDAVAFHPYNLGTQLSAGAGLAESALNQLNALRANLNSYGLNGIEIWATEYGEPTTPGLASPAQQAAYIANFVIEWQALSKTLNLGPAYLYTTRDSASGVLNDEYNYGLFYTDGTPKPAALIVAQLEYDLKNNLPLPSLASTIATLSPGQQAAFVLSEVVQWMRMPITTAAGFAALVAGAALSTVEALPPVNMALAAIGAVLNAVHGVPMVKAAMAAVSAAVNVALDVLGNAKNKIQSAVTAAAFNVVINTVNTLASVGPAVQNAVSALGAAAHNTELTVAAAINGTHTAPTPTAQNVALPTTPSADTAVTTKLVSATATSSSVRPAAPATPIRAVEPASPATAVTVAAVPSTAVSSAASPSTTSSSNAPSAASPAADAATSDPAPKGKTTGGKKAKSVGAAKHGAETAGKHRRDDGQRGESNGPGRHRK